MTGLTDFLDKATCNFTAVKTTAAILDEAGFTRLDMADEWHLEPSGKYYTVKNGSALFAFITGSVPAPEVGFRIISAHTDSPGFKIKPNCEIYGDGGLVSLNVEKYGGVIMYTWFDRPLSVAGRLMLRTSDPLAPEERVVDLRDPVATIPQLAIHLNRQVNEGVALSVQSDMKPVLGIFTPEEIQCLKEEGGPMLTTVCSRSGVDPKEVVGYELQLYPCGTPLLSGAHGEFLQSPRIDDLSMAWCGLKALLDTAGTSCGATRILALFDNEEVGSGTKQGAASPVLRHIAVRICGGNPESLQRALARSFMVSADDAHAWNPNYNSKYDPTNHALVGGGPVIKINANCKYMTDAKGAAVFSELARRAGVKVQYFVNHGDVAGGSTLGNIATSQLDIDGVDVGCAIWAMHSACETASMADHEGMAAVMTEFFK